MKREAQEGRELNNMEKKQHEEEEREREEGSGRRGWENESNG